jgi:hypothetical protein
MRLARNHHRENMPLYGFIAVTLLIVLIMLLS